MKQTSNHRMQVPKGLVLNGLSEKWLYQELVIRFGEYKQPIKSVHEVAANLGLQWYDVTRIVRQDKNHTFLQTDGQYVWAVNRCSKVYV